MHPLESKCDRHGRSATAMSKKASEDVYVHTPPEQKSPGQHAVVSHSAPTLEQNCLSSMAFPRLAPRTKAEVKVRTVNHLKYIVKAENREWGAGIL